VFLTAAAEPLLGKLATIFREGESQLFADFSSQDPLELAQGLERLYANLLDV
jgi:hypothetical protein